MNTNRTAAEMVELRILLAEGESTRDELLAMLDEAFEAGLLTPYESRVLEAHIEAL